MTRKMSMEILAAEDAAERARPTLEDSIMQTTQAKECGGLQYTLMSDDLLIRSGRFAGRRVSELTRTVDGRDYLGAMWKQGNAEIRAVLRRYFSD